MMMGVKCIQCCWCWVFCDFTTNKNKSVKLLDSLLHFLDVKWLKKLWNITSPHSVLELENECLQNISHIKSNGEY